VPALVKVAKPYGRLVRPGKVVNGPEPHDGFQWQESRDGRTRWGACGGAGATMSCGILSGAALGDASMERRCAAEAELREAASIRRKRMIALLPR